MDNTALDLEAVEARCETARCEVNRLCQGETTWTMSIPVRDDDTDVVLTDSFRDIPALVTRVKQLRVEKGQMRFQLSQLAGAEKAFMEATGRAQGAERERDEWRAEVKRLRRELHDERVRHNEWEKMYNQAIMGTEAEHLQTKLEQVEQTRDEARNQVLRTLKEVKKADNASRVLAVEVEHLRATVERLQAELAQARADRSEVWAENSRLAALYQDDADAVCEVLGVEWTKDNEYPTVVLSAIRQLRQEAERRTEALAALVNKETAELLILLAYTADDSECTAAAEDARDARDLAARIREALEETE